MRASQFFVSTLKEAPADAEVVSHQLMVRAGFIKRLSAGIYTYMPMGLRVIRKIEAIVREDREVTDACVARLREHFSEAEVVELTFIVGYQTFASKFAKAYRLPPQNFSAAGRR